MHNLDLIRCIIFDLDDTLCDYQKAKNNAKCLVDKTLRKYNINPNSFWSNYSLLEPKLFTDFLNQSITKEQYRIRRYADILKTSYEEPEKLSLELNRIYMEEANKKINLYDDVIDFMKILKDRHIKTFILTNGPSDGQRDKFNALNLSIYVQKIYISEEIGSAKPNRLAFEMVLKDAGMPNSQILMVGDSLEHDIKGAQKVGIKTVLLDRNNKYSEYTDLKVENLTTLSTLLFGN